MGLCIIERGTLASIGFRRPGWRSLAVAVIAAIVLLAILVSEFALIIPLFHLSGAEVINARARIMETPYWCRVLTVLRAAIVEEILFRAYLMEKVHQLTGSWAAAVVTSVLAFTLAHLSAWGFVHLVAVFCAAIVFALLYLWRRDTISNVIAHFLTDAAGFLLS